MCAFGESIYSNLFTNYIGLIIILCRCNDHYHKMFSLSIEICSLQNRYFNLLGLGHILPFYIHYIGYLNMYKEIDIPEHMHTFKRNTDA